MNFSVEESLHTTPEHSKEHSFCLPIPVDPLLLTSHSWITIEVCPRLE